MAALKGAMTSLSTSQTIFLPNEEPENNRINFRDSLKFFQEQLVINGANLPSPSPGKSGNGTLRKNGSRSLKEKSGETPKNCHSLNDDAHSVRSCKIDIPTVDTILESVRVLRAIQKSQKERGSSWNLDIALKSNIETDFNLTEEWIRLTDVNANGQSDKELNKEIIDETESTVVAHQVQEAPVNSEVNGTEPGNIEQINSDGTCSSIVKEACTFWPGNVLINNSSPKNEDVNAELPGKNETKNGYCPESGENKSNRENSENLDQINLVEGRDVSFVSIEDHNLTSEHTGKNGSKNSSILLDQNSKENERENELQTNNVYSNTPNSLRAVCTDLLNYLNSNTENKTPENVEGSNTDEILNIETYDDTSSIKIENNDCDSGIGTQRSVSSLSPNIPSHTQKDSWSDSCSSHYASAECSPYHSLSNVFESSIGLSSLGETKIVEIYEDRPSNGEWEYTQEKIKEKELSSKALELQAYEELSAKALELQSDEELSSKDVPLQSNEEPSPAKLAPQTSEEQSSANIALQSNEEHSSAKLAHQTSEEPSLVNLAPQTDEEPSSVNIAFQTNEEPSSKTLALQSDEEPSTKSLTPQSVYEPSSKTLVHQSHEPSSKILVLHSDEKQTDFLEEPFCVNDSTGSQNLFSDSESPFENAELDTEISYCSFIPSTTIENPCIRAETKLEEPTSVPEVCDSSKSDEPKKVNGHELITLSEQATDVKAEELPVSIISAKSKVDEDFNNSGRTQKFTAASCDLVNIVESLYRIQEDSGYQPFLPTDTPEETFEETLFILSKGAFCEHPEDSYLVIIEDSILYVTKDSEVLCSLNVRYAEISMEAEDLLKLDNRMGRCVFIKCDSEDLRILKNRLQFHCLKHWQTDCLQLVHYPLKCHQNVVIIDLGSCSTRAGILMDQPTLPSIFFPTVCATDKTSGNSVYGMEALQPEVRHRSNLSFPIRPTNKITKHTVDTKMLEGLFKKIFCDLKIDPTEYTVQVCLPRNLSINTQTALVKLLLEDLKVKAVSMTNQALLTLYAHDVTTAVVVDIGDRTDVLPVVDGFIVENGVTQLPHGGQRLIHHMKHGLAEKRISLSNDIDSFLVQYITESLAYVADDYENEMQIALQYPDIIRKTVTLQPAATENKPQKNITLEEARFKIPEGLFNPDLWGLDSPGIHHLVQKAIQATGVDARRQVAENIYVSGGVTMLPGFVERLNKEVAKLSKTKIVPKVYASNYRYHCTYIGACKFAKMGVFSQVCINLEEYSKNSASALKKCALYF